MPCNSDWPRENDAATSLRKELDSVTRVACELTSVLRDLTKNLKTSLPSLLTKEAQAWIADHDRVDKERKARELRAAKVKLEKELAKSKLTPRERELLGLK